MPDTVRGPSALLFNLINGNPMLIGPGGPRPPEGVKSEFEVLPLQDVNDSLEMFPNHTICQGHIRALLENGE